MITYLPLERLVLTPNPAPEQDFRPIMESIRQFGLKYPLLVVKDGDNGYYHIVDGRTRYKALKSLGIKEAPCIIVDNPEITSLLVEVYRRHLDKKHIDSLMGKIHENIHAIATNMLKKINGVIPEEVSKKLEQMINEDASKGYIEIAKIHDAITKLDAKTLRHYFISNSELAKTKELNEKELLGLQKILQEKTKRLEQTQAERDRLREELTELKKTLKNNMSALVEREVQARLAEINAQSADKYQKLQEKIQKEIEDKYKTEILEKEKLLKERNEAVKSLLNEKEDLMEQIAQSERAIKDHQLLLKKLENEYRAKEETLKKALSSKGASEKLTKIELNILDIDKEVLSTIEYLNLLKASSLRPDETDLESQLENLKRVYSQLGKNISELERAIKHLKK